MAPKLPLTPSSLGAWRCPQCTTRSFASSAPLLKFGPEHPRYIEIPEPPQQTLQYKPSIKGTLPQPRDVFAGTVKHRTDAQRIELSTRHPDKKKSPAPGSREEWKSKMGEIRKQNLREGVESLRERQERRKEQTRAKGERSQRERERALMRPEREDERLTAPSVNFDLEALMNGPILDPGRDERLARKRRNVEKAAEVKKESRRDDLHTLFMNAREFIVTPEQLNQHVEEVFGSDSNPVIFGPGNDSGNSIWFEGRQVTVREMLEKKTGNTVDAKETLAVQRMIRLAEVLTGGKMDARN